MENDFMYSATAIHSASLQFVPVLSGLHSCPSHSPFSLLFHTNLCWLAG